MPLSTGRLHFTTSPAPVNQAFHDAHTQSCVFSIAVPSIAADASNSLHALHCLTICAHLMSQSTSCNGCRGWLCADNFDNSVFAYGWAAKESTDFSYWGPPSRLMDLKETRHCLYFNINSCSCTLLLCHYKINLDGWNKVRYQCVCLNK